MQWFLKWFQYENWATAWQNQQNDLCTQRRLRSAWLSAQSDQSLRCPPEAKLGPTAKTLIRLGGCPCWSESSLGTKVILLVLSWGGSKCFFLESKYAAHIHFITFFTFRIEPNMKSFSHANYRIETGYLYTLFKLVLNWSNFSLLQTEHDVQ